MLKEKILENENIKPNTKDMENLKLNFPQFFDKNGEFLLDRFKEMLKQNDVKFNKEGYELNFLGKSYAKYLSSTKTETFIAPHVEENLKEENKNSENLYIIGDNIDALKHLLGTYSGKIKCIYIDPPYNTGSDGFVYPDDFKFDSKKLTEMLGIDEEEAERIINLKGKSSHSAWLTFMYPRLILARELLSDDGVIFISIDDNEQANLKLMCDEVFGSSNFLCNNIWKSKSGGANDSSAFGIDHEYIFVYAKNFIKCKIKNDVHAIVTTSYNKIDEFGKKYALDRLDKQSLGYQPSLDFPIIGPDGKEYRVIHKDENNKKARWRWSKNRVKERYDELVFIYPYVYTKNYEKNNGSKPRSILFEERFGRTRTGSTDLAKVIGDQNIFNYPKPINLIKYLISITSEKNSIILDFFSGSATTAHAVMQLNAEDGGNRKYILVQIHEKIKEDKPAYKVGGDTELLMKLGVKE